jgi:hypothetical protein
MYFATLARTNRYVFALKALSQAKLAVILRLGPGHTEYGI